MDASLRRKKVLDLITKHGSPLSASSLAKTFSVSRQVIVGDVAILRAEGHDIIATARGYLFANVQENSQFIGRIACQHTLEETTNELYAIVDLGATIVNVIVDHEIYGEITGNLNLTTREDVDLFMKKLRASKVKLLSNLTNGIHLHTIACRDKRHFDAICQTLKNNGFLY